MDPRRIPQHEYGRSRGGDGGSYGALPSSSGRAIPPTAGPSLSTGQGFYTVESLQGATMVPPPQPAPPPPRFMPRLEPDLPPPHLHPAQRADFGPFDRRYPPPAAFGRKMMMLPPPGMPVPWHGDPGMLYHRPPHPPFMADPRMRGFHPGRFDVHNGRGHGNFDRRAFDRRGHNHAWPSQRFMSRKQGQRPGKPISQSKNKKSLADKQNAGEGGPGWCALCNVDCPNAESLATHVCGKRHKKQAESQMQGVEKSDKLEEVMGEGEAVVAVSEHSKDNKGNETNAIEVFEEAVDQALETIVIEIPKGEGQCQVSDVNAVVGRKRDLKDTVNPNKRPWNSPELSNASDVLGATTAEGSEDVINGNEIQETSDLEAAKDTMLDT